MNLVTQPTIYPTNKLSASLFGMVAGAFAFEIAASYFPGLRGVEIMGFGNLSVVFQMIFAGLTGYVVKDRPNVATQPSP